MTNTCNWGGACWLTCAGVFIIWWLVASGLLLLTWNRVIGSVFKTKPAKYWQALLLIATVCSLCLPRAYLARGHCGKMSGCHHSPCGSKHCEHEGAGDGKSGEKEDCPYSKHKAQPEHAGN